MRVLFTQKEALPILKARRKPSQSRKNKKTPISNQFVESLDKTQVSFIAAASIYYWYTEKLNVLEGQLDGMSVCRALDLEWNYELGQTRDSILMFTVQPA